MIFFQKNKKYKFSEHSDEELLEEYKHSKDLQTFGELYNRYIPLVYGVCLKYLQDETLSKDAVMDIFENLQNKIFNYEIKKFRVWLYTVVKNHCFYLINNKKQTMTVDFDSAIMESETEFSLFEEGDDKNREDALNYCIGKLSEQQKTAIIHFFYENRSYAEIVEQTGYELKNVKSYIQNGKRNLKLCIESRLKQDNEIS